MKMEKSNLTVLTGFIWGIVLIAATTVYAGMNPPLGESGLKTTGPAIVGVITIVDNADDPYNPYLPSMGFWGECSKKSEPVDLPLAQIPAALQFPNGDEISFDDLAADIDILEGYLISNIGWAIYDCNPEAHSAMINTINQFYVTEEGHLKAKAIILPVVDKKIK